MRLSGHGSNHLTYQRIFHNIVKEVSWEITVFKTKQQQQKEPFIEIGQNFCLNSWFVEENVRREGAYSFVQRENSPEGNNQGASDPIILL